MICLLVGHRGVGKSSLLQRIQTYNPSAQCWDLDGEIVKSCGKSIDEIFEQEGECRFRSLEKRVFKQVLTKITKTIKTNSSQGDHYLALGAGFEGAIPPELFVLWVRRLTDSKGRVFMDRSRLAKSGSEYDEYLKRFQTRDQRYRQWAHSELTLVEGLNFVNPWELSIFSGEKPHDLPKGQFTLLPEYCRSFEHSRQFLKTYQHFFTHLELRDDLLSEEQLQWAMDLIPPQKIDLFISKTP